MHLTPAFFFRDACILDTFCTHTHPGQICTNTALFCRLSATESINANGPPSNEPSTAPTEAGHEDVRNGDEDGARDTKAGASAEGEGHGAIGDGTAALVEADWGAGLGSRPGMTPKDWSRVPLCDPGEVAVLETWGDWLRLREVPLSSPTPVAMTHALTLIHMLRMCVSASALDLKTILQAHKATQTERLCVHVVSVHC